MKTIDLDQLSSIAGGTAWQPIQYPDPFRGGTAGGGPTIYNPSIRDLIRGSGPGPTKPERPNPLFSRDGLLNFR